MTNRIAWPLAPSFFLHFLLAESGPNVTAHVAAEGTFEEDDAASLAKRLKRISVGPEPATPTGHVQGNARHPSPPTWSAALRLPLSSMSPQQEGSTVMWSCPCCIAPHLSCIAERFRAGLNKVRQILLGRTNLRNFADCVRCEWRRDVGMSPSPEVEAEVAA